MNPRHTNFQKNYGGHPARNPARLMLPVFAAAAMVTAIWAALYFDLPSGVTITLICGTGGFLAFMSALDAMQRCERAEGLGGIWGTNHD